VLFPVSDLGVQASRSRRIFIQKWRLIHSVRWAGQKPEHEQGFRYTYNDTENRTDAYRRDSVGSSTDETRLRLVHRRLLCFQSRLLRDVEHICPRELPRIDQSEALLFSSIFVGTPTSSKSGWMARRYHKRPILHPPLHTKKGEGATASSTSTNTGASSTNDPQPSGTAKFGDSASIDHLYDHRIFRAVFGEEQLELRTSFGKFSRFKGQKHHTTGSICKIEKQKE